MKREKIGDLYQNETTKAYIRTFGSEVDCANEIDHFFLGLVPDSLEGKTVLDLGAGNGKYSEWLHNKGAKRVIAFDLSSSMLEQVKVRKELKQLGALEILQGDLEALPFSDKEVHLVFSRFSLMYAQNLTALIEKLGKILSEDGEMLIQANFVDLNGVPEDLVKRGPVKLNLKVGDNTVAISNFPNTLNDYITSFRHSGLDIRIVKEFPASEISVDHTHPFASQVGFSYVVFHLRKQSQ